MDATQVIDQAGQAVRMALVLGGPLLGAALVVALAVGVVQTLTQMHDPVVGLVPRLAAVLLAALAVLPWAIETWVAYASEMFGSVPGRF